MNLKGEADWLLQGCQGGSAVEGKLGVVGELEKGAET